AHGLPYPFATDLWESATWQTAYQQGSEALYGPRTVHDYIHRPEYELFDLEADPLEARNLAADPDYAEILAALQAKLESFQRRTADPWAMKQLYE
ncbi:MAG: heparan N-sulfatase, partial [Phycisphaerales bacterium JB038]